MVAGLRKCGGITSDFIGFWMLNPKAAIKVLRAPEQAIALIEHHQAEAQNLAVVSHAGF